jgi:hypothetical protein
MTDTYELILNHITTGESFPLFHKTFGDYKQIAFRCMANKGKFLFEEDILNKYKEGLTLKQLFEQEPDRFIPAANRIKKGKPEKTWVDIMGMEEIHREDDYFDFFFTCKLRHLSLFSIDDFLNFHLEYSFKDNKTECFRFLTILIRQYQEKILNSDIIETLREWVRAKESGQDETALSDPKKDSQIKGRMKREKNDKLTSLSFEQTVLLIKFMQDARIILKGESLTFSQAGEAFHILTGYSPNTLRQQLGIKGEIEGVKHEDYKELHQVILDLASRVESKIRKK